MDQQSDRASRRILAVTEEELSRIVLDIHDGPVQYLFAALSLIASLQNQIQQHQDQIVNANEMLPTVKRVGGLIEESLSEIKSFLGTFRPPEFQRRSIASIIKGVVIQHEELSGSTVNLDIVSSPENVPLPLKIALYRILQEALSNANRHSGAKEQWVKLWHEGGIIHLEITDKGRGFQPPPLLGPDATERVEHIGLRGMRDRVDLLGGTFKLESHPGEGTHVTVSIPFEVE